MTEVPADSRRPPWPTPCPSPPDLSTEAARKVIAAAEAKATEIGVPMCIAIADTGGNLKAFYRMDGAALLSTQVAQDKAYTAVGFGMPTHGWHDFIKDDAPLASGAVGGIKRLVIFGGGYTITIGDAIVGAIGVSGGHYTLDPDGRRGRTGRALVTALAFEDFAPGRVFELGTAVVDRAEMVAFARRFDPQPFHVDEEAGQSSIFGELVGFGVVRQRCCGCASTSTRCSTRPRRSVPPAARSSRGLHPCSRATSCGPRWKCSRPAAGAAARSWAW